MVYDIYGERGFEEVHDWGIPLKATYFNNVKGENLQSENF